MLFWSLLIVTTIQLLYWLLVYRQVNNIKSPASHNSDAVSVIICAHNESTNLKNNLPFILDQNYPEYEVVVVDDRSTDQTPIILNTFQQSYSNLRVVRLEVSDGPMNGKKRALTNGISAARYSNLLMTDADCVPTSPEWISRMSGGLVNGRVCIGVSPFKKESGFLNKYIRFDGLFTALQYLGYAARGMAYMGVGRNMIYHKDVFLDQAGFKSHAHVLSGDDDLLFAGLANSEKVGIQIHPDSLVLTEGKKNWVLFFRQKRRQNKTSLYYKFRHKVLLAISAFTHIAHYYLIIAALLTNSSMLFAVVCYTMRLLTILFFYTGVLKRFQSLDLLKWIPILDFSYVIVNSVLAPALIIGNGKKWN